MDFDGDGKLDLLSGSYHPGEIYLFPGLGKGAFAARVTISDIHGVPIHQHAHQKNDTSVNGSWVNTVDWDDDGDLDILVGTLQGTIFRRENVGSRTAPKYAPDNQWVMVEDKKLCVPHGSQASLEAVDWDADGLWDILVGSGNGSVSWYRNLGQRGQPRFAKPVMLITPHKGMGTRELLLPGQEPTPGTKVQIAVLDYDGDGLTDILLGDYCSNLHFKANLTSEENDKLQELLARRKEQRSRATSVISEASKQFNRIRRQLPVEEQSTPATNKIWYDLYREAARSADYQRLLAECRQIDVEMRVYLETSAARSHEAETHHGYVWFFRRLKP